MRIWRLSLTVAVAGLLVHIPARAIGGTDEGLISHGPVRQTGVVITTLQDEPGTRGAESPFSPPDGAGFAGAEDQEPSALPRDPAYEPPDRSPFVEEPLPRRTSPPGYAEAAGCASCSDMGPYGSCYAPGRRSHRSCRSRGCGICNDGSCPGDPLPLFRCGWMDNCGLKFGGWIDSGISAVANNPSDRYNGLVTFNDRHGEYQMNQLWTYLERSINPNKVFDIGARVDLVYGTDARFTQAVDGLEADWNQEEPFYQVALPQFYVDASLYDWTFRAGHFLTVLGYEVVPAPGNFFYSHAYCFQYGQPKTHTGFLLMRDVGPFSFSAGLQRGNDQFDDTDGLDALGYLGSVSWRNWDGDISSTFAVSATEQGPGVETLVYTFVSIFDLSDRFTWALEHDYGRSTFGRFGTRAQWYGVNQYLLYEINCRLSMGVRCEWFRDEDGTRVAGLGVGNRARGPFIGDFYEVTLGLNWRPHGNITVRPEVRWDWFDQDGPGRVQPFDSGNNNEQFMFACDFVMTF